MATYTKRSQPEYACLMRDTDDAGSIDPSAEGPLSSPSHPLRRLHIAGSACLALCLCAAAAVGQGNVGVRSVLGSMMLASENAPEINSHDLPTQAQGRVVVREETGIPVAHALTVPPAEVPDSVPVQAGGGPGVQCALPGQGCKYSLCCKGEGQQCFEKDDNWADCMYQCDKEDWSCKEIGQRTPLKHPGCSEPGENCALTRCCKNEGQQCYEKDEFWAACQASCDAKSGWSCNRIGDRTPFRHPPLCGEFNENCALAKCCKDEGAQCYAMDKNYATCAYSCKPGVGWSANWSCDALGERSPLKLGCSWSGEACIVSRKCCHPGQQCIRKNQLEAYCTHKGPGKGWDGTVLGGAHSEFAVDPVSPTEARGTTLFCFMAILPGSYEEILVSAAQERRASIFGCEAHAVFNSWQTEQVSERSWNSFVNTDVFVDVWKHVKSDGQYHSQDWTVKVDPDTVFFPDRLRRHLGNLQAPHDFPIYIKNTDRDFGFLGAIEVFSKEAMDKYFDDNNDKHCLEEVGVHSGEDGFMKGCMDMLGAGYMKDVDVLRTPAANYCTDGARVAFHAFKDRVSWEGCYNAAQR